MPKHLGSIQLQPRDIELLRGLFESRLMTITHAAEIHFGGKRESAKKRIQRLKAAGFIRERPRKPYEPSILHLARKGVTSLSASRILAEYPPLSRSTIERRNRVSEITFRHELQVMEVKAAFYRAVRENPEIKILSFCTWPLLNEFTGRGNAWAGAPWVVRPDGVIRALVNKSLREIYIELDRSTERHAILAAKAARYADLRASNRATAPNTKTSPTRKPFTRVHFIVNSDARRRNIEDQLAMAEAKNIRHFRVSTLADVLASPALILE